MELGEHQWQALRRIIEAGLKGSAEGLSALTGGAIHLGSPRVALMPLEVVPGIAGGPGAVVVAVYVGIRGDLQGHAMLLLPAEAALRFVEILAQQPPGTLRELDPVARSALAEAGNICAAHFLTALGDATGLEVMLTAPVVVEDMAGAILQTVVADLYLGGDWALVVETDFRSGRGAPGSGVRGHLLLMPDQESMARLVAALEAIP
ncbi:MAG: chemotaxis protein CheX [Bacillota bacterium]|nr:MAG: hypothetical protein DIU70_09845 [Bacillota bacterium]